MDGNIIDSGLATTIKYAKRNIDMNVQESAFAANFRLDVFLNSQTEDLSTELAPDTNVLCQICQNSIFPDEKSVTHASGSISVLTSRFLS